MTSESNRISAASTSYIDSVCRAWAWSWTGIAQADDDGLDGLICIRTMSVNAARPNDKRSWTHKLTGGLIYVQVKTGASYIASQSADRIEIHVANIEIKRKFWQESALPVVLIYVKEEAPGKAPTKAWWADLKSSSSYADNGNVIVSRKNRFQPGLESRRPFARLASGQHRMVDLPRIDMSASGPLSARLDHSTGKKSAARSFYRNWKAISPTNPALGAVLINRTGWSHITRLGRPLDRILKSYALLPAAARIVASSAAWQVLRRAPTDRIFQDGKWAIYDYVGLSAMVEWPASPHSEVMVILKRETLFEKDILSTNEEPKIRVVHRKTWFYSVYEPGRGK